MAPNLTRIAPQSKKLADHVYDTLSDAIIDGTLAPGERLREAEVAEALGVSRTPVRETFAVLQRQHLLEQEISGAYYVTTWDSHMLWEVATLRTALEGLAVELAAPNLTSQDMGHLHDLTQRMATASRKSDQLALEALDMEFHSYLWARAGHSLLQESLERMKAQIRRFVHLTPPVETVDYAYYHRQLMAALRQGDHSQLRVIMQNHILEGAEHVTAIMEKSRSQEAAG